LRFRVWELGFRFCGSGYRVEGSWFRVQDSAFRFQSFEFGVSVCGRGVSQVTQLKAQGPARTSNESKEEEEGVLRVKHVAVEIGHDPLHLPAVPRRARI